MTFKINGVDFGEKVEVAGYTITPRKVIGTSAGYLLNGEHIADVIANKTDLKIRVVATEQEDTSALARACTAEYCQLFFNDPITNANLDSVYEPQIDRLEMAIETDSQGKTYWYGFTITFMEK